MHSGEFRFRPKKKVGQIYINIPGVGSMSVEAIPERADNLNEVLLKTRDEFCKAYRAHTDQFDRKVTP